MSSLATVAVSAEALTHRLIEISGMRNAELHALRGAGLTARS